jgi:hypothetical protein
MSRSLDSHLLSSRVRQRDGFAIGSPRPKATISRAGIIASQAAIVSDVEVDCNPVTANRSKTRCWCELLRSMSHTRLLFRHSFVGETPARRRSEGCFAVTE